METDRDQGTVSVPGTERRTESQDMPIGVLLTNGGKSWRDGEEIMSLVLDRHRDGYMSAVLKTGTSEPVCEESQLEWDNETDLPLDEVRHTMTTSVGNNFHMTWFRRRVMRRSSSSTKSSFVMSYHDQVTVRRLSTPFGSM